MNRNDSDRFYKEVLNPAIIRKNNLSTFYKLLLDLKFTLTGSRSVENGHSTMFSDWDYFIKESDIKPYIDTLNNIGFTWSRIGSYFSAYGKNDPSIVCLYEYGSTIDIQVIKDEYYDAKVKTQVLFEQYWNDSPKVARGFTKREWRNFWRCNINFFFYTMKGLKHEHQ